jgi:hypothetical protein
MVVVFSEPTMNRIFFFVMGDEDCARRFVVLSKKHLKKTTASCQTF